MSKRCAATAYSKEARSHDRYLPNYLNEFTVLRVDRAEPSKNIVRGFQAFDRFLEAHPEFLGRVNFVAILVPSRMDVEEYQDYLDDVSAIVGRINAKYANVETGWQPIHLIMGENYPRALAAMKWYDVLLVNTIIDGMNLVAKEGCLLNERNGVLILSEGAGRGDPARRGRADDRPGRRRRHRRRDLPGADDAARPSAAGAPRTCAARSKPTMSPSGSASSSGISCATRSKASAIPAPFCPTDRSFPAMGDRRVTIIHECRSWSQRSSRVPEETTANQTLRVIIPTEPPSPGTANHCPCIVMYVRTP